MELAVRVCAGIACTVHTSKDDLQDRQATSSFKRRRTIPHTVETAWIFLFSGLWNDCISEGLNFWRRNYFFLTFSTTCI